MRHFFAAWWKARTRREGHTWGKGDPRRLLRRALSTPGLGTRGGAPRVFRRWRAVGKRTGRGPRGSCGSTAIPPRAPSPGKGTQTGGPSCPGRVSATAARGRGGRPGGLAQGMSPPSLRGRKCGGPESGTDSAGSCWPGLPSPSHSRPEGAAPHLSVPGSTTWAAAERDRSACLAAGTRSWGACPKGSQGRDCGRVSRPGHVVRLGSRPKKRVAFTRVRSPLQKPTRTCLKSPSPRRPPSFI